MTPQRVRRLNRDNIRSELANFSAAIAPIDLQSYYGQSGASLLRALKRHPLGVGPYPAVSMFESANRILTDLVILTGVAGLLDDNSFPFSEYIVELGHEDNNGFDLMSTNENGTQLVGEAFNVAETFFQTKKGKALKKLRDSGGSAAVRVLMYNADAVDSNYRPKPEAGEVHVIVDTDTGSIKTFR